MGSLSRISRNWSIVWLTLWPQVDIDKIFRTRPPREAFLGPLRQLLGADLDFFVKVPETGFNGRSESTEGTIHGTVKDESCGKKSAVLTYLELKGELGMRGEGGPPSRIVPMQICFSGCC